ncbi:uncharacterized protein LOC119107330 [Pollicipes pollicipes]|uniref:uncharacterized protein LOC119107330 n=1 Tax=Pollicipes pollicipes TaxID=41117 RepID=UPI001884A475|nr:uncharacterized protein LOC119107330 [Pollicipes pollicipes]
MSCPTDIWSGGSSHLAQQEAPVVVRDGTNKSVVLDCNYTLAESDVLFHVKWFHIRSGHTQVYQWIHDMAPQALGPLKHHVNLQYQASEDTNERYRALQILRPTVNLSGEYLCRATSALDSKLLRQRLIVYAPPQRMTLFYTRHGVDMVNVTCHMEGVYPEPHVQLYRGPNTRSLVPIEALQKYVSWRDGLYVVTAFWLTRDEFLDDQTLFVCSMSIPDTDHQEVHQITYPGADHMGPPEAAVSAKGGFKPSAAGRAANALGGPAPTLLTSLLCWLGAWRLWRRAAEAAD